MGYSLKSVPFFSEDITIWPHTACDYRRGPDYLGKLVSIREFSNGATCSLDEVEETGELIVRRSDGHWIQGPEV